MSIFMCDVCGFDYDSDFTELNIVGRKNLCEDCFIGLDVGDYGR